MTRVKVINEPTEIVPLLLAVDTPIKRRIFNELINDWCTEDIIFSKYGKEGGEALRFFEKQKLVETLWQPTDNHNQEKAYRAYYDSIHINVACSMRELSLALRTAIMDEEEFKKIDDEIYDIVSEMGMYSGDVLEALKISSTELKSLIRRSTRLEHRGHRIERIN